MEEKILQLNNNVNWQVIMLEPFYKGYSKYEG